MQVVYKDEVERVINRRADSVGPFLYTERSGRYLEGEHYGRIRDRRN